MVYSKYLMNLYKGPFSEYLKYIYLKYLFGCMQ